MDMTEINQKLLEDPVHARRFCLEFNENSYGFPIKDFQIHCLTDEQVILLALECYKTLVEVTIQMASKQWTGDVH